MWRYRGSPYYLAAQGERFGLSRTLTDRARYNPEIHRIAALLGQLCERYHRSLDGEGNAVLFPMDLAQIRGTLLQCQQEAGKLHALAAATQIMIDEAFTAFDLDPPERNYRVACDSDPPPAESNGSSHSAPRSKAKSR